MAAPLHSCGGTIDVTYTMPVLGFFGNAIATQGRISIVQIAWMVVYNYRLVIYKGLKVLP